MNGRKKTRVARWPARPMTALAVLDSVRDFEVEEAATLANEARMSWHRLTAGTGTMDDYDRVAIALNVTAALCDKGHLGPAYEAVTLAQHALIDIRSRYQRVGRFGADATALRNVPPGLDLHDQVLALINPLQLAKAMRQCYDAILARNVIDPRTPPCPSEGGAQ